MVEQRIENPRVGSSILPLATNSKSPNSFRAFSHLLAAPVQAGIRGFASRASLLPSPRFWPFMASLFSVFIWWSRERARRHFQYWCGFWDGRLWLATGRQMRPGIRLARYEPSGISSSDQMNDRRTLLPAVGPLHTNRPLLPSTQLRKSVRFALLTRPTNATTKVGALQFHCPQRITMIHPRHALTSASLAYWHSGECPAPGHLTSTREKRVVPTH